MEYTVKAFGRDVAMFWLFGDAREFCLLMQAQGFTYDIWKDGEILFTYPTKEMA